MPSKPTCALSLRIRGDELVPHEINALLAASPSYSHAKGDELPNPGTMDPVAPSGIWVLAAPDDSCENLSNQIDGLLSRLTDDLAIWAQLNARFSTGLYTQLHIKSDDERAQILPNVIRKIADRGLEIGFRVCRNTAEE